MKPNQIQLKKIILRKNLKKKLLPNKYLQSNQFLKLQHKI